MFVKKNDKVKVIAGKDKGKEGVIEKVFPAKDRVIVKGVNIVKKHQKRNQVKRLEPWLPRLQPEIFSAPLSAVPLLRYLVIGLLSLLPVFCF